MLVVVAPQLHSHNNKSIADLRVYQIIEYHSTHQTINTMEQSHETKMDENYWKAREQTAEVLQTLETKIESIKGTAADITETTKEKAAEGAEGAKNIAGDVIDTVKEKAIAAKDAIVETASKAVEGKLTSTHFKYHTEYPQYLFFKHLKYY